MILISIPPLIKIPTCRWALRYEFCTTQCIQIIILTVILCLIKITSITLFITTNDLISIYVSSQLLVIYFIYDNLVVEEFHPSLTCTSLSYIFFSFIRQLISRRAMFYKKQKQKKTKKTFKMISLSFMVVVQWTWKPGVCWWPGPTVSAPGYW